MHLSDELLSAYQDGELALPEATAAAAHLRACAGCARTARLYAAVDERLTATPALGCAAALTLLSAELDGELEAEESSIARAHRATCAACRSAMHRWAVADQAIAAFPLARPSGRIDLAIAALGRAPAGLPLPRVIWPARGLAVATVVALILVLNLSFGPAAPGPHTAIVAAIEQSVLDPVTGTLYVLNSDNGTVSALDALTLQARTVISVGGRPTALALNATTNTLLVLDPTARTVTEIDCASNAVTSSTAVSFPGTPTSVQVDPSGKLVVTSIVAAATSNPAAIAPAGIVSVFDGGTKQLQTVKTVDVAPSLVVWQANGKRALLVSVDATTLVDTSTYQQIARYAGGIAAAFSPSGDFAILSGSTDGAVVTRQSGATVVGGMPHAIAALPDGRFAVLSDAAGHGHIFVLSADGIVTSTVEVAAGGRDLAYDATTKQLALVGVAGLTSVALPAAAVAAQVPTPTDAHPAPTVSAAPTAVEATKPTPSGAATVTPPQSTGPSVAVIAPSQGLVPADARAVWPGTYLVQLALQPRLATSDRDRIWMLDTQNRLSALHPRSGELYTQLAQLPTAASISRIVASANHVYLTDPAAGLIYVFTIDTEHLSTVAAPFLPIANDIVASPDDRLWLGTTGLGLLTLDPKSGKFETTNAEANVSAVGTDPRGRVWMGAGSRPVVAVYDPLSQKVAELNLPHEGVVSAIAIDGTGAVWVGTDTGQLFAIRNDRLEGAAALGRPINGLVIDGKGQAWYVTLSDSELLYGLASGAGLTQHALRTASGPLFDALGRAWQTDGLTSGVYVTILPGIQP
jgi:YVTN family beta-propeller protein